MELPEELVEVALLPDDPDLDFIKPPREICLAVKGVVAGGEPSEVLTEWLESQRVSQKEALVQLERLAADGELSNPASRGLPKWFLEKWAPILNFPWSHKLSDAVESAKSWG